MPKGSPIERSVCGGSSRRLSPASELSMVTSLSAAASGIGLQEAKSINNSSAHRYMACSPLQVPASDAPGPGAAFAPLGSALIHVGETLPAQWVRATPTYNFYRKEIVCNREPV